MAAFVPVPEAAVDEDGGAIFWEDDVRGAREFSDIHAVPESPPPKLASGGQLGASVPAVDVRHAVVPLLWCHPVRHCDSLCPCRPAALGAFCLGCVSSLGLRMF